MNLWGVYFLVVVEKRLIKHRGFQRWEEVLHLRASLLLSELGRGMFKIVRTIISCELYLLRSLVIAGFSWWDVGLLRDDHHYLRGREPGAVFIKKISNISGHGLNL
jgi:hypothetical protein